MKIADTEQALIDAIKEVVPKFTVMSYPEKPDDVILKNPMGAVFVRYDGSDYSSDTAHTVVRLVTFECIVVLRYLRNTVNQSGVYDVLDSIRGTVSRGRRANVRWVPVDEGFLMNQDGIWQYGIRFQGKTTYQLGS